jgi:septal ring factor EnvC (AmiA/AmiB activator)
MNIAKKISFFLLILITQCIYAASTSSINIKIATKTQELNHLNQQILGLKTSLDEANEQRRHYEKQLQTIEETMGVIANKIAATNLELKKQDLVLEKLKTRQEELKLLLNQQQFLLAKQIRAAYMLGQHPYLKILLNQQNPNTLDRLLIYHKRLHMARLSVIKDLNQTLTQLKSIQTNIDAQVQHLQKLENTQAMEKDAQTQNLAQREQVVTDLKRVIEIKALKLATLVENKKALEDVLQKLKQSSETVPQPKVPFNSMRGRLLSPCRGAIVQHYGERIGDSSLINNAILIRGNTGDAVSAVYPGKVVFADWLRGVGLLIILDHGHGYLTLYGHNHSLLKRTGDVVTAGEQIAKVGNSGGYEKSGLYFQIRADGKPINPEIWLKK